jgi:hypothetical protein
MKILANILLSLAGVFGAILLLELGVRFLPPPYDYTDPAHTCSNDLGWRGMPNYEGLISTGEYTRLLKHNHVGMHDTDHSLAKPQNVYRILMLGDSFTWAGHVNEAETGHQILEDLLNDQNRPERYEVMSAAITGWSTGQQLLYYRTEGRLYNPDLVLLMFYIGNDVIGNLPGEGRTLDGQNCFAPYFALCQGQLDPQPWLYAPGLKPAWGECSAAQKLLATFLGSLYHYSYLYTHLEPLFTAERPRSSQVPYYPLYIPERNEMFDDAWQVTLATIKQIHQEVKQDGAEFILVLISPADVINLSLLPPEQLDQIFQKVPDLRQAQPDLPYHKLSEALSGQNITILNLQPLFIERLKQNSVPLYFPTDKHWTPAGHRLAAERLAAFILSAKNEKVEN